MAGRETAARGSRWLVSSVLLAGLLLGVAACDYPSPWEGDGPRAAVVGDSLVYHAEHGRIMEGAAEITRLSDDLNQAGFTASVGGHIGADIPLSVGSVGRIPAPTADVLVFASGTNDANGELDVEASMAPLRELLDATDIPCVVLVTVGEAPGTWNLDRKASPVNAALRVEAEARDDVLLADWAPVAVAHPEYLDADGAHMTDEGQAAYRAFLVDAARACRAHVPPPTEAPPTTALP